jgi:hypothetical protein
MDPKRRGHLAYLLRLWRVDNGAQAIWRASLQDVRTGEQRGFAGLDEAVAFLRQQLDLPLGSGDADHDPGSAAQ